MIGLRGLGQVDVEPLAQAFMSGAFQPSFNPPISYQPPYLPVGQETTLPGYVSMTDASANQMASLLGCSVDTGPVQGFDVMTGYPVPQVNYINCGGDFLPGNVFQPGVVLSFSDLCEAENYLAASIDGGQFGPLCSQGVNTPNPYSTPNPPPVAPSAPAAPLVNQYGQVLNSQNQPTGACAYGGNFPSCDNQAGQVIPFISPYPAQTPNPIVTTPVPVATPVTAPSTPSVPAQSNGSQAIVSPTVGSSTPAPSTTPPANTNSSSSSGATASGCFNPLSQWITGDTCIGPLGIVEWGLLAVAALYVFGGKH